MMKVLWILLNLLGLAMIVYGAICWYNQEGGGAFILGGLGLQILSNIAKRRVFMRKG